jgi:hypothetical protein
MAEIHRLFRHGFGEGPDLVRRVREGDLDHAAAVAAQLDLLSVGLHAHHQGEDQRLWNLLDAREPACSVHVARMKVQHAQMLENLEALDAALPGWRSAPAPESAAPVLAALDGINAALGVHLGDEEKTIVPVMERTLTQAEVDWFAEHGRKATPKGQLWNQLGAILAAQPDGGGQWLHENLPAPVRVLWRWVGKRRYEKTRAALVRD